MKNIFLNNIINEVIQNINPLTNIFIIGHKNENNNEQNERILKDLHFFKTSQNQYLVNNINKINNKYNLIEYQSKLNLMKNEINILCNKNKYLNEFIEND